MMSKIMILTVVNYLLEIIFKGKNIQKLITSIWKVREKKFRRKNKFMINIRCILQVTKIFLLNLIIIIKWYKIKILCSKIKKIFLIF